MQKQSNSGSYANEEPALRTIEVSLVEDEKRMAFLPAMFGPRNMMRGEGLVYGWMRRLSSEYNGGFWNFYRLSNGGFYLAPTGESLVKLSVWGNGFDGTMSPTAAGIVASLFALGQLANEIDGKGETADEIINHYHLLRAYAGEHPEGGKILGAID